MEISFSTSQRRIAAETTAVVRREHDHRVLFEIPFSQRGDDGSDAGVERLDHRFDMRSDVAAFGNHAPLVLVPAFASRPMRWVVRSLPGKVNREMRQVEEKRLVFGSRFLRTAVNLPITGWFRK